MNKYIKVKRKVDERLQAMAKRGDWKIISIKLGINRASIDNNRFGRSDRRVTEIETALIALFEERKNAELNLQTKKAKLLNP